MQDSTLKEVAEVEKLSVGELFSNPLHEMLNHTEEEFFLFILWCMSVPFF